MSVVSTLERTVYVQVELEIRRIALLADSGQIRLQVFVDVVIIGLGRLDLVVDGGMEGESLVHNFKELPVGESSYRPGATPNYLHLLSFEGPLGLPTCMHGLREVESISCQQWPHKDRSVWW